MIMPSNRQSENQIGKIHPSPGYCPNCRKSVPDLLCQDKKRRAFIITCPHCGSVRKQIREPGYRVRELVVVTTLTDTQGYPKDAILDLFHDRWQVELDLRAI